MKKGTSKISQKIVELLLPIIVSSIFAYFISMQVTQRQLAAQNVEKLVQFREVVEKALQISSELTKRVQLGKATQEEAISVFQQLAVNCVDAIEKFKSFRPYLSKKHRTEIDKLITEFEREYDEVRGLWMKTENLDPSFFKEQGKDPLKILTSLGKKGYETLEGMRRAVVENLDEL